MSSWLYGSRTFSEEFGLLHQGQPAEITDAFQLNVGDTVYLVNRPKNPEARHFDVMLACLLVAEIDRVAGWVYKSRATATSFGRIGRSLRWAHYSKLTSPQKCLLCLQETTFLL
jgi:hypothetical protein